VEYKQDENKGEMDMVRNLSMGMEGEDERLVYRIPSEEKIKKLPKGKELIFEINECPYLPIAIKAEPTFKEDLGT
jgi:hypothetical protein